MADTVAIDTSFVETRMAELGLKQFWLAEQLGVTPHAVLRWVNGLVRRIPRDHLAALARHLRCREEDLTPLGGEASVPREDPRAEAARQAVDDEVLALLTSASTSPVMQALSRASLTPGLAPHTLGKLYNMLSLAAGRQFLTAEAIVHASRAEAIGRELGNQVMVVRAWYAEGWARLNAGEIRHARRMFQRCIDEPGYLHDEYDVGMAWFGLGSCQGYEGNLDPALSSLEQAVLHLESLQRPLDLALPLYVSGVFLVDGGRLDEARVALVRSLDLAIRVASKPGIARATAALGEVASRRGDLDEGLALVEKALGHVGRDGYVHPHVFLSAARVFQFTGDFDRALECVDRGLGHAAQFRPEAKSLERLKADLSG